MKTRGSVVLLLTLLLLPISIHARYTKPIYVSLPGPGNVQHPFKPEQFVDDRFYKAALKTLGNPATR